MENNWPETIDELMEECRMLVSKTDLYELGERGEPFTGESEPRVDGTDYLAGEYQYGVAMIPAQWVTHVLGNAMLGRNECEFELNTDMSAIRCSACGYELPKGTHLLETRFCGGCGKVVKQ